MFAKINEVLLVVCVSKCPTADIVLVKFIDIVNESALSCISFKVIESVNIASEDTKPRASQTLNDLIRKRRRLFAKWRKSRNAYHRLSCNKLRSKNSKSNQVTQKSAQPIYSGKFDNDTMSKSRPDF